VIYTDLYGEDLIIKPGTTVKTRRGAFAICVYNDHVLLSWSHFAPDLAEFPGGGIEEGETVEQALIREVREEATVALPALKPVSIHAQMVQYYANKAQEFWDYDQQFWVVKTDGWAPYFFGEDRVPEDAHRARWVPLSEFKTLKMHAMHERARAAIGL